MTNFEVMTNDKVIENDKFFKKDYAFIDEEPNRNNVLNETIIKR